MIVKIAEKYDVCTKQLDYNIKKQIIHKMKRLLKANLALGINNDSIKQDFIALFEGCALEAYYEKTGKAVKDSSKIESDISVGYGFNMSRPESKDEWIKALPETLFDKVKKGLSYITEDQALSLLQTSLSSRTDELKRIFGCAWDILSDNMRIAIESAYYNVPVLFSYNSLLRQYVFNYCETGHEIELLKIARMFLSYKHKNFHISLNVRRRLESFLLCGEEDLEEVEYKLVGCDYLYNANHILIA